MEKVNSIIMPRLKIANVVLIQKRQIKDWKIMIGSCTRRSQRLQRKVVLNTLDAIKSIRIRICLTDLERV